MAQIEMLQLIFSIRSWKFTAVSFRNDIIDFYSAYLAQIDRLIFWSLLYFGADQCTRGHRMDAWQQTKRQLT